jgi:hypothetical protein
MVLLMKQVYQCHYFNLKGHGALTQANDSGVTFKQIARFVEAHPEAVFSEPA